MSINYIHTFFIHLVNYIVTIVLHIHVQIREVNVDDTVSKHMQ